MGKMPVTLWVGTSLNLITRLPCAVVTEYDPFGHLILPFTSSLVR
jgi:hypothetical protein